jgi:hypothetical protein
VDLAEHRIPYLRTGTWQWPDYGVFHVGPEELAEVKQHFDDNVRGDDLPIINLDHDPRLAVGWIKGLEFSQHDPELLEAITDLNPVGEALRSQDQVRHVSPELLRNYRDAATGRTYRLVAAGLDVRAPNRSAHALTNYPRLKNLGRIAASETEGGPSAAVLAFAEGAVIGARPREAALRVLAEGAVVEDPTTTGGDMPDVDEPTVPENTGDATATSDTAPPATAPDVGATATTTTEPAAAPAPVVAPAAPAPAIAPPPAPAAAPELVAANLSETQRILAAEQTARRDAEQRALLAEQRQREAEARVILSETSARLERALDAGKINPAQLQTYQEHIVSLSEPGSQWILEEIEARPDRVAVPFGERGSGLEDDGADERTKLDRAARTFMSEQRDKGTKLTYKEALLHVSGVGFRG